METQRSLAKAGKLANVRLNRLRPGRQRLRFQEAQVLALKDSILKHGLLHPIVVRRTGEGNELEVISGHRRLEALRRIGVQDVSCKIVSVSDREAFEISLVENLQRDSIEPIEEAMAFHHYIDICKWGNRRSLANRIGKSPEYVAHRLQLLELPSDVLSKVGADLSISHAEELSWLEDEKEVRTLAKFTIEKCLSVHDLHELVRLKKRRQGKTDELPNQDLPAFEIQSSNAQGEDVPQVDEFLKTSVLGLRYLMSYLDNCVNSLDTCKGYLDFKRFLTKERYNVHQILDDFISAQIKLNRSANKERGRLPILD